ncbi:MULTISPECIES: hypothetical protein, partial [unclassified Bradyrhizobium]|uniref:hypothetical protein n=1 Tax=unclassified Bradyrhizobium TaxID=2631580 RepID=UPI001FF9EBD1
SLKTFVVSPSWRYTRPTWPGHASRKWRPLRWLRWLRQPLASPPTHCGQAARHRKLHFSELSSD